MRAKTEQRVKRWNDQRWVIDSVIQAIGMEWDQPRLAYTMYPCGPDAIGDFRGVGMRVRKFADMHRELAAAARRRELRAAEFEAQGRIISARESYFIAALLWSAARWPIFENNENRSTTTPAPSPAMTSSPSTRRARWSASRCRSGGASRCRAISIYRASPRRASAFRA